MPLKGVSRVRSNYGRVVKDVSETKTLKVVTAVVATGAAWAKLYTPVDMSALINSQLKTVDSYGGYVVGKVWYMQNYAVYLEDPDGTNPWTPRKKKSAKPHFLKSGFEDDGPQTEIRNIILNGYKL
ncbi:MAG: hypothetical protein ACRC9H_14625 [Aeromonas veronii]